MEDGKRIANTALTTRVPYFTIKPLNIIKKKNIWQGKNLETKILDKTITK